MFGRGQREELDEEDGEELVREMRRVLGEEVRAVEEREGVRFGWDEEQVAGGGGVRMKEFQRGKL